MTSSLVPNQCYGTIISVDKNELNAAIEVIDIYYDLDKSYQRYFAHQIGSGVDRRRLEAGAFVETDGFTFRIVTPDGPCTSQNGLNCRWHCPYIGTEIISAFRISDVDLEHDGAQWNEQEDDDDITQVTERHVSWIKQRERRR